MTVAIGSHGFHASLTVIAGLACFAAGYLVFGHASPAFDAWVASAKDELATRPAWLLRTHQLTAQVAAARATQRQLEADTARLRQARDSAVSHAVARVIETGDTALAVEIRRIGQACHRESVNCEARAAQADSTAQLEHALAAAATGRAERADSIIRVGLKVKDCQVNLLLVRFGCPSRTATFVIGGGLGTALGIFAAHH